MAYTLSVVIETPIDARRTWFLSKSCPQNRHIGHFNVIALQCCNGDRAAAFPGFHTIWFLSHACDTRTTAGAPLPATRPYLTSALHNNSSRTSPCALAARAASGSHASSDFLAGAFSYPCLGPPSVSPRRPPCAATAPEGRGLLPREPTHHPLKQEQPRIWEGGKGYQI